MYTWHFAKITSQQGKILSHRNGEVFFSESYLLEALPLNISSGEPLTVPWVPVVGCCVRPIFTVFSVGVPVWVLLAVWLTGLVVVAAGEGLVVVTRVPGVLRSGGGGLPVVLLTGPTWGLRLSVIVWTGVNVPPRVWGVSVHRFSRILSPPPPEWPPLVFAENRSAVNCVAFHHLWIELKVVMHEKMQNLNAQT